MDETLWARYKHSLTKQAAREHIVKVQHTKAQNAIGPGYMVSTFPNGFVCLRLVEKFMEKHCSVFLLPDISTVPNLDAWLKQAAAILKVVHSKLFRCSWAGQAGPAERSGFDGLHEARCANHIRVEQALGVDVQAALPRSQEHLDFSGES